MRVIRVVSSVMCAPRCPKLQFVLATLVGRWVVITPVCDDVVRVVGGVCSGGGGGRTMGVAVGMAKWITTISLFTCVGVMSCSGSAHVMSWTRVLAIHSMVSRKMRVPWCWCLKVGVVKNVCVSGVYCGGCFQ